MNAGETSRRSRRQWEAIVKAHLRKGKRVDVLQDALVSEGLDRESAEEIVDNAVRNARNSALKLLIGGGAFAGLGLMVTVATFLSAALSGDGHTYLIWFGPVLCGGIAALIGFVRLLSIRS